MAWPGSSRWPDSPSSSGPAAPTGTVSDPAKLGPYIEEEMGAEHVNVDDPDPARQLIADWFAQRLGMMPKPSA